MIRIGIELNNVIRNINKQILKYYQKDIKPELDIDEIDEKDDPFKYCTFNNPTEKTEFVYIDYPYELFGCAKTMSKDLPTLLNNWMSEMTNIEDEDFAITYYSLNEEALTIQSSFFFLSKIGTRVREVTFPKKPEEVWEKCDVVISANKNVLDIKPKDKISVKISSLHDNNKSECDFEYDSMSNLIKDNDFIHKIIELCQKRKKESNS